MLHFVGSLASDSEGGMSHFWGRNGTVPVQGGHRVVSRIRRWAQQGDMTRADLISILMSTELEEHQNLTREQARAVVNEIFGAIAEALRNGEVTRLPFGSLGVSLATWLGPLRRFVLAHPWDVDVEGVGFCWSVARRA